MRYALPFAGPARWFTFLLACFPLLGTAEPAGVTRLVYETDFSVTIEEPDATDFVWSPDGRAVAVHATMLRKVTVFAAGTGQQLAQIDDLAGGGRAIEFIADGQLMVPTRSGATGGLTVWNPSDGSMSSLPAPADNGDVVTNLLFKFSVDARRSKLVGVHRKRFGAGMTFAIAVYDVASRTLKADFPIPAREALLSPDGAIIAALGARGRIDFIDSNAGQIIGTLNTGMPNIRVAAWSPDSSSLVTGAMAPYGKAVSGTKGLLQLWDVRSRRRLAAVDDGFGGGVESLDISSDGAWLATTTSDGVCRLWDAHSLKLLDTVADGLHPGTAIARFSPDGSRLAILRTGAARISLYSPR